LETAFFISSMVTAAGTAVDSLRLMGLARLGLPGKRWVFGLIVATLMVPGQILPGSGLSDPHRLGWLDTAACP